VEEALESAREAFTLLGSLYPQMSSEPPHRNDAP
jgi:hypothetical protein